MAGGRARAGTAAVEWRARLGRWWAAARARLEEKLRERFRRYQARQQADGGRAG